MKLGPLVLASLVALSATLAAKASERAMPGVTNPAQAHQDYILKCQGCHRPDGSGDDRSNPPMRGIVARFLTMCGAAAASATRAWPIRSARLGRRAVFDLAAPATPGTAL